MKRILRSTIKSLSFEHKKTIFSNKDNYVARGEINNRDVLLKIVPITDLIKVNGFLKESLIDQVIQEHNQNIGNKYINSAKVISAGKDEKFAWAIRRYYPGSSLSEYHPKNRELYGYDKIRPKFVIKRKNIIQKIAKNIKAIQTIEKDLRKTNINKEFIPTRFEADLDTNIFKKITDDFGIDFSNHIKIYKSGYKKYYEKSNIVACTGDLVPSNILVLGNNNVLFSDLEWFCFDNYTIDLAYLWLFLHKYPKWQKEVTNSFIYNTKDRQNFQISILRLLYYWYGWVIKTPKNKKEKRIMFYKKHKWTRYLLAAGESYEAIMKVK